jgi:hypothetical protein
MVMFFGLLSLALHAQGLFPTAEIRGVTFPFYAPADTNPAVIVHMDRVHRDYQRRGFFRIGSLPLLAVEKVTVDIAKPDHALAALLKLDTSLRQAAAAKSVECRDVTFRFAGETVPRLRAARIRLSRAGVWELLDCAHITSTAETPIARALLHLSGNDAGQLVLQTSKAARFTRFPLFSSPNNSFPATP